MIPEDFTDSRILVVDDNELNVEQLEMLLEDFGYKDVLSILDPRRVKDAVLDYQPDIVLLDLHMPHLSGLELIEILQVVHGPDDYLPILVLTADAGRETRERALQIGAQDFLTKPFDHTEVIFRVRNLLRTRRLHRQLRDQNSFLDSRIRDRTQQLELAAEELRRAQEHLLAQERLRAMGQMASGIAHDFNNAISIILGHTEILRYFDDVLDNRSELKAAISEIGGAAADAAGIVKRLREFYQPEAEEPNGAEDAELRATVEKVIALTKPRWKSQAEVTGRTITIETDLQPARVSMPATRLREVLTNLIFNAVDALPEGGTITIRTGRNGHCGEILVADNGNGMSDETLQSCLQPFFTTKGRNGTGLGLGIVNELIRRQHGDLSIESAPGEGARFTIRLPLSYGAAEQQQPDSDRLARCLRVLIVDDDLEVRELMQRYLHLEGHTFAAASNGRAALARFFAETFDLVITDRAMPGINGDQLVEVIKQHVPDQQIIMLTGFGDIMKATGDCPAGVSRLLSKPVSIPQLRQTMFELFNEGSTVAVTPECLATV